MGDGRRRAGSVRHKDRFLGLDLAVVVISWPLDSLPCRADMWWPVDGGRAPSALEGPVSVTSRRGRRGRARTGGPSDQDQVWSESMPVRAGIRGRFPVERHRFIFAHTFDIVILR